MNRDQHLQKKDWRLPLKSGAETTAAAVVTGGRAATSLPLAGAAVVGSSSSVHRQPGPCPGKDQASPVKTLPVSN